MFQEFRGNLLSLVERSICLRAMNTATAGFRLSHTTLISKSARIAQTKSEPKFVENEKVSISLRLFTVEGRSPNWPIENGRLVDAPYLFQPFLKLREGRLTWRNPTVVILTAQYLRCRARFSRLGTNQLRTLKSQVMRWPQPIRPRPLNYKTFLVSVIFSSVSASLCGNAQKPPVSCSSWTPSVRVLTGKSAWKRCAWSTNRGQVVNQGWIGRTMEVLNRER